MTITSQPYLDDMDNFHVPSSSMGHPATSDRSRLSQLQPDLHNEISNEELMQIMQLRGLSLQPVPIKSDPYTPTNVKHPRVDRLVEHEDFPDEESSQGYIDTAHLDNNPNVSRRPPRFEKHETYVQPTGANNDRGTGANAVPVKQTQPPKFEPFPAADFGQPKTSDNVVGTSQQADSHQNAQESWSRISTLPSSSEHARPIDIYYGRPVTQSRPVIQPYSFAPVMQPFAPYLGGQTQMNVGYGNHPVNTNANLGHNSNIGHTFLTVPTMQQAPVYGRQQQVMTYGPPQQTVQQGQTYNHIQQPAPVQRQVPPVQQQVPQVQQQTVPIQYAGPPAQMSLPPNGQKWSGKGNDCSSHSINLLRNRCILYCDSIWRIDPASKEAVWRMHGLLKDEGLEFYEEHIISACYDNPNYTLDDAINLIRSRFIDPKTYQNAEREFNRLQQSSDLNDKDRPTVHQLANRIQHLAREMHETTPEQVRQRFFNALDIYYQQEIRRINHGEPHHKSFQEVLDMAVLAEHTVDSIREGARNYRPPRRKEQDKSDKPNKRWGRNRGGRPDESNNGPPTVAAATTSEARPTREPNREQDRNALNIFPNRDGGNNQDPRPPFQPSKPKFPKPRDDRRPNKPMANKPSIQISAISHEEELGFEHEYPQHYEPDPQDDLSDGDDTNQAEAEDEDHEPRYFLCPITLHEDTEVPHYDQLRPHVDLSSIDDDGPNFEGLVDDDVEEPSFSGRGPDLDKPYMDYFMNEILRLVDNEWDASHDDELAVRMMQTHLKGEAKGWFHETIEPRIGEIMIEEALGLLQSRYSPRSFGLAATRAQKTQPDIPVPNDASIKIRDPAPTEDHRPRVHDCLTVDALVAGKMARLMVDTGAGMDFLADKFVAAYDLPFKNYANSLKLSLATSGSSAKVHRWTSLPIRIQGKTDHRTWEIAHLASWDGILGAPFLFDYAAFVGLNPPSITFGRLPGKVQREGTTLRENLTRITPKQEDKDSPGISFVTNGPTEDTPEEIEAAREEIRALARQYTPAEIPLGGAERPRWMQHSIEPVHQRESKIKSYPVPQKALKSLMKKLQVMEAAGVIRRPQGPVHYADPLFVKIKPGRFDADGDPEIRLLFDLRARNASVNKVLSPLPDQEAIVRELANAKYKTRIDLTNAYEQIRLTPESVKWTAFATPIGFFEITVMQQGDNNAAACFQSIIWRLFANRIAKDIKGFIDDVYVHNKNLRQHVQSVKSALITLYEAKLYSNPQKLLAIPVETTCLGRLIHMNGSVRMSRDQRQALLDWPEPKDSVAVSRFLGVVNWLAGNIPKCAKYTSVLSELGVTSKRSFQWNATHTQAFEQLKSIVHNDVKLFPLDYSKLDIGWKIFLFSDASHWGTGGWIGMGLSWEDAHKRPALFHSRKFNKTQLGYNTHAGELLALYDMIRSHESMLIGYKFTICTDNTFVSQLMTIPTLTDRERRIASYLDSFDREILHIPGPKNWAADAFSRLYENHDADTPARAWHEFDHELQGDDAPHELENRLSAVNIASTLEIPPEPFPRDQAEQFAIAVRRFTPRDKVFSRIFQDVTQYKGYLVDDGMLWLLPPDRRGEAVLCVPEGTCNGRQLREIVTNRCHRTLGHLGYKKTIEYIRHHFWWPTVSKDVLKYCETCDNCNREKNAQHGTYGFLQPIIPVAKKWYMVSMDWVQLKEVMFRGRMINELLIMRDMYQGIVRGLFTHTARTAEETALEYVMEIYKIHGIPEVIVSDRDPVFTGGMWRDICRLAGIKQSMTTAYHPQGDGSSEISNRTALQILRHLIRDDQDDWPYQWPHVEFAINSAVNSSLGVAPFELWQGYLPRALPDLITPINKASEITAIEWAERTTARQLSAHDNLISSRISQATQANKSRRPAPEYKPGDKVWLSTKNLKLANNRVRKLAPRWIGPIDILSVSDSGLTLQLNLGDEFKKRRLFPKFNVEKTRPYIPYEDAPWPNRAVDTTNSLFTIDPNLYLIDSIKDHKVVGRLNSNQTVQFLVSWLSQDDPESWVTDDVVEDTPQLAKYLKLRKVSTIHDLIQVKAGAGGRAQRAQARAKNADASISSITVRPQLEDDDHLNSEEEAEIGDAFIYSTMKVFGVTRRSLLNNHRRRMAREEREERGRPRDRNYHPYRSQQSSSRASSHGSSHPYYPSNNRSHIKRLEDKPFKNEPKPQRFCHNCGRHGHTQAHCKVSSSFARIQTSRQWERDWWEQIRRARVRAGDDGKGDPDFTPPALPQYALKGQHIGVWPSDIDNTSSTTNSSLSLQDKASQDVTKNLGDLGLNTPDEEMEDDDTNSEDSDDEGRVLELILADESLSRTYHPLRHNISSIDDITALIAGESKIGLQRTNNKNPYHRYLIGGRDEVIDRSSDSDMSKNLNEYDRFFDAMLGYMKDRSEKGLLDHSQLFQKLYDAQPALHQLKTFQLPQFDLPELGWPLDIDADEKTREIARLLWLLGQFAVDKNKGEQHVKKVQTFEPYLSAAADEGKEVGHMRAATNKYIHLNVEDFQPGFHTGLIDELKISG